MNILFIGNYRSADGWGEAARAYALSLLTTKHNITLRPIYMSTSIEKNENIPPQIVLAEQNKSSHYDVIIQKVLPNLLEFPNDTNSKYVGFGIAETAYLQHTSWPYHLNQMEYIISPSHQDKLNLEKSDVTTPISVIHEAIDIQKYEQEYNLAPWKEHGLHNLFLFYFVGEHVPRKNLKALLTAFHREFSLNEPVGLLIKTSQAGLHPQQLLDKLDNEILQFKKNLGIYQNTDQYIKEWIITEHLPQDKLCALHQICDCFVMPSHGEACCRPMLDAAGFGNSVIVTQNTGMVDYINPINKIIPSTETPVVTNNRPLPYLYTARETWQSISILELQKAMRQIYEQDELTKIKTSQINQSHVKQFSYEKIGQQFNEFLEKTQ